MPTETKQCPKCDQEIGKSEVKCPKCGFDFEVWSDEQLSNLEAGVSVIEKRRAKREVEERERKQLEIPAPAPRGFFDSLRRGGKQ